MGASLKTKSSGRALKRWKIIAVAWPLLCIVFAGIIISQRERGGEERIVDAVFAILPLIFFAIGVRMRLRVLKERAFAAVPVSARVVSGGVAVHPGNNHYYPEYEFEVDGETFHVKSHHGYGSCHVTVGSQVKLYYSPEDPKLFYVPAVQRLDNCWAVLLCGVGFLWPVMGLFAPQMRAALAFLSYL